MAAKGSLSFIEQHLEKGLLGLAALFMLGMGVYFFGLEPNRVDFAGEKVGPRELDEAILRQAEDLQRAVKSVRPKSEPVPGYADKLRAQFDAGVLGAEDGGPLVPPELPVAALFGPALPALEEQSEAREKDIVLVTPLRPVSVAVRTGISLVSRRQATLGAVEPGAPGSAADDDETPAELSWVSVGAYFPEEAQQREMTKAGYAGHRAKVYVVGVDVQRQELTASGDYSDWTDVEPGKAIPKLDAPAPVYDSKTGELLNQMELDAKLDVLKASRPLLMQPPFYPVQAGDEWEVMPLPGHEPKGEEEEAAEERPRPKPAREPKTPPAAGPRTPPPAPPPIGGGRGMPGGGGRGMPGGGRGMPGGGGFTPQGAPTPPPPKKEDFKDNLKEARKALSRKDWNEAERLARAVADNPEAPKGDQAAAKRIVDEAERGRRQSEKSAAVVRESGPMEFVRNPGKEGEPAIWFHDDSVQPGKTYRYRMRVQLWNRYAGRRAALRDPSQADHTVLEGEWSLPGPPITVAPKRHFFVRGPSFGEPAASVDVFTWHKGNWLKEDFKVKVGDVIGGVVDVKTAEADRDTKGGKEKVDFSTNAIVLDLRIDEPVTLRRATGKAGEFAYRDTKTLVLVYLDPADGQVKERVSDVDRTDPLYKKLKDKWEQARGG